MLLMMPNSLHCMVGGTACREASMVLCRAGGAGPAESTDEDSEGISGKGGADVHS